MSIDKTYIISKDKLGDSSMIREDIFKFNKGLKDLKNYLKNSKKDIPFSLSVKIVKNIKSKIQKFCTYLL